MKSKKLIFVLFVLSALLLSACKINLITDIKSDGSGMYVQELGFTEDEAAMVGLSGGGADDFCENANAESDEELPPGTTVRQETRGEGETWCIFETPFKSLDELKDVYATTDLEINKLSLVDDKLVYDVTLDMSGNDGGGSLPLGNIYWMVTLPGKIGAHNATEVDGNTLKWKLQIGQENSMRAESTLGGLGFDFDGGWLGYVLGGGAFLCLCCFVPLVIAAVVFFFIRRKKQTETTASEPNTEN